MRLARARIAAFVALAAGMAMSAAVAPPPAPDAAKAPPPKEYRAPFAATSPALDGRLDDAAWQQAPWSDDFVDIEGTLKPAPAYRTRVKIIWDAKYLYIGAEMADPDVWASLQKHDEIVFHDNDFEAFIDPNGDGREYYELEANALGTIFDLFLQRKYRDGGPAVHEWNAEGLVTKITVQGSLNDPRTLDAGWTLEWAVPWSALRPPRSPLIDALPAEQRDFGEARRAAAAPKPDETWRINFSRVQWRHNYELLDGTGRRMGPLPQAKRPLEKGPDGTERGAPYAKRAGLPEDNWVWSPQWVVDMHLPEFWGKVRFVR